MAERISGPGNSRPTGKPGNFKPKTEQPTEPSATAQKYTALAQEALGTIGTLCLMGGQMTGQEVLVDDGAAIAVNAEAIGTQIGPMAEKNAYVARALEYFAIVTPVAAVATAVMPLVVQLIVNHRVAKTKDETLEPAEILSGAMPPSMLRAKFQAQMQKTMAEMQLELLKEQQEANEAQERLEKAMAEAGYTVQETPVEDREPAYAAE